MGIAHVSNKRKISAFAAAALLLSGLSLGGCATSTAGSSLMNARAQAAPPKTSAYLPVEDLPPKRENPAMTPDEQLKLKKDLTAARDHQAPKGKAKEDAAHAKPLKP
jgi:hypothetical protein